MALAVPPKNSDREFSILSAFQISQKDCQNLINLHKNSQNPQKQGRVIDDGSNVVNLSFLSQPHSLLLLMAVPSSVGLESTTEVSFSLQNGQSINILTTIYRKR